MLPIIYFVLVIFWGAVWGVATNAIIQNKGYSENWFWWGFFFSLIAVLVALSKPQVQNSENTVQAAAEKRDQAMLSDNGWKCDKCGRTNPSYTGTCVCGQSKLRSEAQVKQRLEEKRKMAAAKRESDAIEKVKRYKELLDSGRI